MQNGLRGHNRYPGTRSFDDTEVDQIVFFGRSQEVYEVLHQLLTTNLLVLYGKSGLGKTSLLRAGLFPELRHHDLLPLPVRLNDQQRPPLTLFFEAIEKQCRDYDIDYTPGDTSSLWEFFKTALFFRGPDLLTPVLVLDQFEELFTLQHDARRAVIVNELADISSTRIPEHIRAKRREGIDLPYSDRPPDVKILLSLREDDLGALEELTGKIPGILEQRYRLQAFDENRARQALEEPARVDGKNVFATQPFRYEEETIDQIITFLKGRSGIIEPFQLQILCQHIEDQVHQDQERGQRDVRVDETYLGGTTSMEQVLQNFYETTVKQVTPQRQYKRARELCEEGLISQQGRRLPLEETEIINTYGVDMATLNTLVDRRLLRREPRLESVFYEISHDIMAQQVAKSRRFRIPKRLKYIGSAVLMVLIIITVFIVKQQQISHDKDLVEAKKNLAETLLANNYMTAGLEERDTNNNPLKASHYFIRAMKFSPNSDFAQKAQLASAALLQGIHLRDILEPKGSDSLSSSVALPDSLADSVGLALSPDKNRAIAWKDDGAARVWNRTTNAIHALTSPASVTGATFRADGQQILTWNIQGTAHLWDAATGAARIPTLVHEKAIWGASFSPDGQQILTWSADGTARLWDAGTGAVLTKPLAHKDLVRGAMFSQDGQRILTWSDDATARIWDRNTGQALTRPIEHQRRVWGAAFSPDGERILTWSEDGTARVWDSRRGIALSAPLTHKASVSGAQFSPDGHRVLTWSEDKTARVWDSETGIALTPPLADPTALTEADFGPAENQVQTWSTDGTLRLWDLGADPAFLSHLPHQGRIKSAAFSSDANRLLTWSATNLTEVWALDQGVTLIKSLPHQYPLMGVQFGPMGKQVLTWNDNGAAKLWDQATDAEALLPLNPQFRIKDATFSPDGNRILLWSANSLMLWERWTGKTRTLPLDHKDAIVGAALSSNRTRMLTWSADGIARVWDSDTDGLIAELVHEKLIRGASFSQSGKRILTWSLDNTARVWDAARGTALSPPLVHQHRIRHAVFSPNGDHVLSWTLDGEVHLWNSATGTKRRSPVPGNANIREAVFTQDGQRILTWSTNQMFRAWDQTTGIALTPLLTGQAEVKGVVFSPGGQRILTWNKEGSARLWTLHVGEDTPRKHPDLQLEIRTGTRLNDANELEVLSAEAWREKKRLFDAD
jgi:WD40 repeat protein